MKVKTAIAAACTMLCLVPSLSALPASAETDTDTMNMFQNSDFIEKEQPELTDETKQLISLYQRNPTQENYLNLRSIVIDNYNAVLDRKEAKLAELREETAGKPNGDEKVVEMEDIVQEMYKTYWSRINSNMLRFTDSRLLKWNTASASTYDYIPVMGAGNSIYVKRTPVTNAEYAEFIHDTGTAAPSNWENGIYPAGEDDYPVNFVSYDDASAYCEWLTAQDGINVYRLPNESEWELAAGHMPKDADFNCGIYDGRTPVDEYADVTRGAHGAVDFWGNVWEWTSTVRSDTDGVCTLGVKGGSWCSDRTDCRTEYRLEGRISTDGYEDVGFRVIQVLNGEEPEQKVELATLDAPVVHADRFPDGSVVISWTPVENALEYQIFEYSENTSLVRMLDTTSDITFTVAASDEDVSYRYIVQPISYTAICDNVSAEYSVAAVPAATDIPTVPNVPDTSDTPDTSNVPDAPDDASDTTDNTDTPQNRTDSIVAAAASYDSKTNRLTLAWDTIEGTDTYYVYKYNPDTNRVSKARTIIGANTCSYRKLENGKDYYYIISTYKLPLHQKYNGAFSILVSIPF